MTGNQPSETRLDAEVRALLARHEGRPAWIFSAEGDTLVWANPEGLALLLADSMETARATGIAPTAPAARSLRTVARTPVDSAGRGRIEILRINTGGQQETLVATCKPIDLAGERAVLALGSLRNTRSLRSPAGVSTPAPTPEVEPSPASAPIAAPSRAPASAVSSTLARPTSRKDGSSAFEFNQRSRPHRFSFIVELDGRIASLSAGLADAVGPLKALRDGETASLAVADRIVDAPPALIRALANRQRFGEQTVLWPVSDSYLAVPVRLSGFGEDDGSLRVFGTVLTAKAQTAVADDVPPAETVEPTSALPADDVIEPLAPEIEPVPTEADLPEPSLSEPSEPEPAEEESVEPQPAEPYAAAPEPLPVADIPPVDTPQVPDPAAVAAAVGAMARGIAAGLNRPAPAQGEPPAEPEDVADLPLEALPQVDDAPWGGLDETDVAEVKAADDALMPDEQDELPDRADDLPADLEVPLDTSTPVFETTELPDVSDPAPEPSLSDTASDAEDARLSRPERLTFQEIARRLGARITGKEEFDKGQPSAEPDEDFQAEEPTPEPSPFVTDPEGDFGSSTEPSTPVQLMTVGEDDAEPNEPLAAHSMDETVATSDSAHVHTLDDTADEDDGFADLLDDDDDFEVEERPTSIPPRLTLVNRDTTPQDALRTVEETLGERPTGQVVPFRSADGSAEKQLLDRLPMGLLVYADDKLLYANRTALDMIGLQSIDALRAYSRVENLFEGGMAGRDGAMTLIRLDGTRTRVTGRLQSIRWEAQPAALLTIQDARAHRSTPTPMPSALGLDAPTQPSRDPMADPEGLQLVRAQVAELEAIIDLASDGVVTLDRTGEIKSLNQAAQALVGYSAGDLVGRPFRLLFAEDSRQTALDYLEDMAGQSKLSLFNEGREVECLTAQGGLVPVFMTLGLLTDDQPPVFCAVLRDLSPFKQAETDLVEARRAAERANAHKSDFLARVSHEIRTPLNAVIGFSEVMLEERFGPVGSERYRQYLRDIHTSGEHLMSLLNDLLDLSKIEAGRMELNFGEVDLNDVVQQCLAIMQPQASQARIIVRTSLPLSVPKVVSDIRSVRQVVLNLMSNAIKFTDAGGQIIISTLYEPTGEVSLRVRDTGRGMTQADVELALEPFRQVPTTINQVISGTGLGLPLTKALVEANKAQFALESTPGEGTLAKVTFPSQRVLAE